MDKKLLKKQKSKLQELKDELCKAVKSGDWKLISEKTKQYQEYIENNPNLKVIKVG